MRSRKSPSRALGVLITVVGFAFTVGAIPQSLKVTVSGRVLDQNSAAITGATVTLQRTAANYEFTTTTDDTGAFKFENVVPGEYRITVFQSGFATKATTMTVASGSEGIDIVLEPGPLAESVVVASSHLAHNLETIENTPGSISIVDAQTLESSRAFNSGEVLRKVAGINIRDEEGFGLRPNIGIRGLNPTRSSKVLLLEDGIPLTYAPYGDNASYYHPPIDRFESVEVLKGSGQILYGPQTVGGVINYITPTPPASSAGWISLTGGNRDYFNGHINYGDTIRNTGVLFDFTRKQGRGARENVRSGLNDFNFKSITTLTSKQAVTIRFNYYGERSNVGYSGAREDEFRANPRQNPFRNDFFYGNRFGGSLTHGFVITPEAVLTTTVYGSYFRRHWWRQSSNSNERPNDASDPQCGGMANLNTTCGNQGRLRAYYFAGVEPRLRITKRIFDRRNELDFGFRAHFENQDRRQENGDRPTSRNGVLVEDNQRRNQAYSGFIQNRFFFGKWVITPGLRLEHIKLSRLNRLINVSGKTQLTQLVPGMGLSYKPSEKMTIFAGVHRGFAPPRTEDVINNTTGGSIDLDPELSWNYEAGVRARPVSGVALEGTFFRMDYENQIVPASLAGGIGSTFTNGGRTLHQGLELSWRFDSAALLGQRYNIYLRGAYTLVSEAQFRGVRFSSVPGFATTSVSGNRLPYAPKNFLTTSIGYAHPSGFDGFLETVYVGSQFGDDLNSVNPISGNGQTGMIPSYTIWNGTVNYSVEKWRTTFFITAKNLFDRLYITDRARGILPGPPRALHAGLRFNF